MIGDEAVVEVLVGEQIIRFSAEIRSIDAAQEIRSGCQIQGGFIVKTNNRVVVPAYDQLHAGISYSFDGGTLERKCIFSSTLLRNYNSSIIPTCHDFDLTYHHPRRQHSPRF